MQNLYTIYYRISFHKLAVLLLFCHFMTSCKNENNTSENTLKYFNLTSFIQQESARLTKENREVTKTVFLNGKEEQKKLMVNDWEKELNAFLDADINKKSFLGKYTVEPRRDDTRSVTHYSAQKENLRTRTLDIAFGNDGAPVKISAVLYTSNILYSSHQQLTYERDRGYWISGNQTIRFLEPDTFSVAVIFQP